MVDVVSCAPWDHGQRYPTRCDPRGLQPSQSPLSMGIIQARILERVAFASSRGSSRTEGWNPSLLHWQVDSLPQSHRGKLLLTGRRFIM